MIEHLVLVNFKPEVTDAQKADIRTQLLTLKDEIPGILDINTGANFSDRSQGYDTALRVRFESKAALEAYGPHPKHQEIVQTMISAGVESMVIADFEI